MPIYEYECLNCQAVYEKLKARKDAGRPEPCPDCGSEATVRRHSTFASLSSSAGSPASAGTSGGCGGSRGFS